MKTAISIPDTTFDAAERMASQLGISRSELYSRAVRAFLETQTQRDVTNALNRVYGEVESELDEGMANMQSQSLQQESW